MATTVTKSAPYPETVEAVVFDVGRVIVQWDLRHLVERAITDPAEQQWVLDHVITESWHYQHDAGRPLSEMVAERTALFPHYADLIDRYATSFTQSIPGRVEGTAQLIERLSAGGVPLFAITNFGADFWEQFAPTEPVLELFGDIVISGREKLAKPDPAIFRLAARRFGLAPRNMLFIDDNGANIASAAAHEWQVHHFTDANALEEDLRGRRLLLDT